MHTLYQLCNMENIRITELTPEYYEAGARLLTETFYDNPPHEYIFSHLGEEERRKALLWIFQRNMHVYGSKSVGFAVMERAKPEEDEQFVGMFFLEPPNNSGALSKLWGLVSNGLLWAPYFISWQGTKKMLQVIDVIDGENKKAAEKYGVEKKQMWMIHNVAVEKRLRGNGIGSSMLRKVISDIVPNDDFVLLDTQTLRNVRFYERLGFRKVGEGCGDAGDLFPNYVMLMDK